MASKTNNNIAANLKKYFYSGIGIASHTGEIVRKSVNEFVKQGRVSESDGKRIVDNAVKKIESRMPEFEAKYHEAVNKAMKFAHAEIAVLQKKIASYEKKNSGSGSGSASKAARKPVAKKAASKAKKAVKKAAAKVKKAAAPAATA